MHDALNELLNSLEELEAKATPGPWTCSYDNMEFSVDSTFNGEEICRKDAEEIFADTEIQDAELIVALRNRFSVMAKAMRMMDEALVGECSCDELGFGCFACRTRASIRSLIKEEGGEGV